MIEYQKEKEKTKDVKRLRELDTLIKRIYNNQQVRKIALNSAYIAITNQYFAFFSIDLADKQSQCLNPVDHQMGTGRRQ